MLQTLAASGGRRPKKWTL